MKRKVSKKTFTSIAVVSLASLISVGALASPVKNTIEVLYDNIKIVVDGKNIKFGKDSKGKEIQPFIYNGTTYLPVRAVGEAIGKDVNWDEKTKTVVLGEKKTSISEEIDYLADIEPPYQSRFWHIYKSNDKKSFEMAGRTYRTGFVGSTDDSLLFNLDGRFEKIEGVLGAVRFLHPQIGRNVDIYLDGELYTTYLIKHPNLPEEISIPVKDVKQLQIVLPYNNEYGYDNSDIGFGDVVVK